MKIFDEFFSTTETLGAFGDRNFVGAAMLRFEPAMQVDGGMYSHGC
jgi:hypothetical protein